MANHTPAHPPHRTPLNSEKSPRWTHTAGVDMDGALLCPHSHILRGPVHPAFSMGWGWGEEGGGQGRIGQPKVLDCGGHTI